MNWTPRRAAAAAADAALGLTLAGCGSGSGSSGSAGTAPNPNHMSPRGALLDSYRDTLAAKSAKLSLNETVAVGSDTEKVTASGVSALGGHEADLTTDVTGVPGSIEVRLLDKEVYVKVPKSLDSELGGKPWLSIDLATLKKSAGLSKEFGQLAEASASNLLDYVKAIAPGVKRVGTATVQGQPCTEYSADVDLSTFATSSHLPTDVVAQIRSEFGAHGRLPVQVWVNDHGEILQEKFSATATINKSSTKINGTVELSDYGVALNVTAPPASQTTNLSTLLSSDGSGG